MALQVGSKRFNHRALRGRNLAQLCQLIGRQCTGVGVGEKPCFIENKLSHRSDVINRRRVAVVGEPLRRDRIAVLGSLAKCEECFVATNASASDCKSTDLRGREVRGLETSGRLGKGAIAASVTTQHRQRNEYLWRIGDSDAKRVVANRPGSRHEFIERSIEPQHGVNPIGGFVYPLQRCPRAR
ncbi:unannotated protein [freshwater metagenome]|uniref:Unannotated protein n=1 Tax=freshwater metagenome TaxID=449393 RepID=A0A6J6XIQ9_9ZZZZ